MPTSPEKRESLLWRDQYDRTAHASVSLYLNPSHSSHSLRFQPRATRPPLRSSFSFSILWLSPLSGPQLSHTPSSRLFPSPHDLHQVEENVVCQTVGERGVDLSRFSQQRTVCGRIPSPLWVLLTPRCSALCLSPFRVYVSTPFFVRESSLLLVRAKKEQRRDPEIIPSNLALPSVFRLRSWSLRFATGSSYHHRCCCRYCCYCCCCCCSLYHISCIEIVLRNLLIDWPDWISVLLLCLY